MIYLYRWIISLGRHRSFGDPSPEVRPGERKETSQAGRLDARQRLDAREYFLEISAALWRAHRVFGAAHPREFECQYAIGIEALGNGQQPQETLDHQPCADQ